MATPNAATAPIGADVVGFAVGHELAGAGGGPRDAGRKLTRRGSRRDPYGTRAQSVAALRPARESRRFAVGPVGYSTTLWTVYDCSRHGPGFVSP